MTTPAQPDNTRVSESLSYDSFGGSTEWSNEDALPNNNPDYDDPRSSYYQTPASALRESSVHDEHYRSPSIVDYYADAWNRSTTFTPTDQDQNIHSPYHQPSGINYYNNHQTNYSRRVSIVAQLARGLGRSRYMRSSFIYTRFFLVKIRNTFLVKINVIEISQTTWNPHLKW